MSDMPGARGGESGGYDRTLGDNTFIQFLRQPRMLLILLAAWAIIGALTEAFSSSDFFLDLNNRDMDGALAGRALGWESIPLAVLYLYCAREPGRFPRIFWLALIEQAVAIIACFYHWGRGDLGGESILIPVVVSASLGALVFLHIVQHREPELGST